MKVVWSQYIIAMYTHKMVSEKTNRSLKFFPKWKKNYNTNFLSNVNIFRKRRIIYLNTCNFFLYILYTNIYEQLKIIILKRFISICQIKLYRNMHAIDILKINVILKLIHDRIEFNSPISFSVMNDISNKQINSDAKFYYVIYKIQGYETKHLAEAREDIKGNAIKIKCDAMQ